MKRILSSILVFVLILSLPLCLAPQTNAATKLVAITFDDGPSGYTSGLLDGLKSRGAKATFFLVGNRIGSYPELMRRMVSEGHQIANHTTTHPELSRLSAASIRSELGTCESKLKTYGGNQTYCLRPPYGSYNATVRQECNAPIILWSVDTLDWKSRNADSVYSKIINNTTDGSIVLLHDLYPTSVQGALRAIDTLKGQGYKFVTVNELFRRRGITLQKGSVYTAAYNKGITLPAANAPAAPTIKLKNVLGGKKVTLSCDTKKATIYYTTDGSIPSEQSIKYTGAFNVTQSTTVKAVACKEICSEVSVKKITLSQAPLPKAKYKDGKLTLTAAENTTLYYGKQNTEYTQPVALKKACTVLVRGKGMADNTVTYTLTKYGALFTDISHKAWYYDAVGQAVQSGIMVGTKKQTFNPEGEMTRAMFVTALYRLSGESVQSPKKSVFTDVELDSWYSKALDWGVATGIVKGISDTCFAPDESITREQMCALIHRYLKHYDITPERQKREAFTDEKDISSWAKKDVYALYEMKLVNGMGDRRFAPLGKTTRAQCAQVLVSIKMQ